MMMSGNDFPKTKFSVVDGRSKVTEMVQSVPNTTSSNSECPVTDNWTPGRCHQ